MTAAGVVSSPSQSETEQPRKLSISESNSERVKDQDLAAERAKRAPKYIYGYNAEGGWVALDSWGRRKSPPVWTHDAVKGGRL